MLTTPRNPRPQITEPADAYAVPTSNNRTDVVYANPFGFSLTAIEAGGDFIMCVRDLLRLGRMRPP